MKAKIICVCYFIVVKWQNPFRILNPFLPKMSVYQVLYILLSTFFELSDFFLKQPATFSWGNTGIFHVLPSYIINYFVLHNTIIFTLSFLNYGCLGKIYIYGDNHIFILAKERMRHFALTTSSIIQLQKTVLVVLKTLQIF